MGPCPTEAHRCREVTKAHCAIYLFHIWVSVTSSTLKGLFQKPSKLASIHVAFRGRGRASSPLLGRTPRLRAGFADPRPQEHIRVRTGTRIPDDKYRTLCVLITAASGDWIGPPPSHTCRCDRHGARRGTQSTHWPELWELSLFGPQPPLLSLAPQPKHMRTKSDCANPSWWQLFITYVHGLVRGFISQEVPFLLGKGR